MYEWSLEEIYPSFESEDFQRDMASLDDYLQKFEALDMRDDLDSIRETVSLLEDFELVRLRLTDYISLTLSADTGHAAANNADALLRQKLAGFGRVMAGVRRFLGGIRTDIRQDSRLAASAFYFDSLRKKADHLLSDEVEDMVAKLSVSGGDAWEQLFAAMTAGAEGSFRGEKITLSGIRNLAYDPDPDIRREAYEEELRIYQDIKEPVAFALNNIKAQVNTLCRERGYASPLEESLEKSRMKRETLDALWASIRDFLPSFRAYLRHKARLLGHGEGLPFYDLFAPLGDSGSRVFGVEEARDYLTGHFREFSPDLADMTEEFFARGYIDFLPRKGKVGGAFCENLPFIRQSRILTNFGGTMSDVVTLAHELGHAYHGMVIEQEPPLICDYSLPVAETASTFNENIIMNAAIREAGPEEKLSLIEAQLSDVTQITVDIYSRYLFESEVFERRQSGFLSSKDLEGIMLEAQRQAYGDGLDPACLHPYMWTCKPHYYSASENFYNYPYAFGGLFARGLYSIYREAPEGFVERYRQLLLSTTSSTVEETAAVMGIDLTRKEFWTRALEEVRAQIESFIAM